VTKRFEGEAMLGFFSRYCILGKRQIHTHHLVLSYVDWHSLMRDNKVFVILATGIW